MFALKSFVTGACPASLGIQALLTLASPVQAATPAEISVSPKQVIGQTALVEETESDFSFPARVDTGATTSSLHVEDCRIEGEADEMAENVGKAIRFRIKNRRGESEWLERKIEELSIIKTSEQEEHRYKVRMTLNCLDVEKRVLVSLNDRSHMTYPVLLGRNFLQGDFVVDVDLGKKIEPVTERDIEKVDRQQQVDVEAIEPIDQQPSSRHTYEQPKQVSPGQTPPAAELSLQPLPAQKLPKLKSTEPKLPEQGERTPATPEQETLSPQASK